MFPIYVQWPSSWSIEHCMLQDRLANKPTHSGGAWLNYGHLRTNGLNHNMVGQEQWLSSISPLVMLGFSQFRMRKYIIKCDFLSSIISLDPFWKFQQVAANCSQRWVTNQPWGSFPHFTGGKLAGTHKYFFVFIGKNCSSVTEDGTLQKSDWRIASSESRGTDTLWISPFFLVCKIALDHAVCKNVWSPSITHSCEKIS